MLFSFPLMSVHMHLQGLGKDMDLLLLLPTPQAVTSRELCKLLFNFFSSSKAKVKNGSTLGAGKKLISLNQVKNVVDCIGFWLVYI